jgi:hypothetical protein
MPFSIVQAKIYRDATGAASFLPVLLSDVGIVRSLLEYQLTINRSLSVHKKLVRAAKVWCEYIEANRLLIDAGTEPWKIFNGFGVALRKGTVDPTTKNDPSGLYWDSISPRDASYFITLLTDWFSYLSVENELAAQLNPAFEGTRYDQRMSRLAYEWRRNKAFLGHTWDPSPKTVSHFTTRSPNDKTFTQQALQFPEERFLDLLFTGFKVGGKYDYRGMCITLLLFGGGLRVSEPFQMFMTDAQRHWDDPTKTLVLIHHPTRGLAPGQWKNRSNKSGNRRDYLSNVWGLSPRTEMLGDDHAGWKRPCLDDKWFMQVHWFPDDWGHLFTHLWDKYQEQIVHIQRSHPWAWINLNSANAGGIYTIKQYTKALERAVMRINLPFGKQHGTSAHGFRHAYGQRARRAEINEVIIQRMMHHASPDSQKIYTQPDMSETQSAMTAATNKLRESDSKPSNSINLAKKLF